MVIDHITHEFQRKGNAAKLVTRTSGSSIQAIETKLTLRELEQLAAEFMEEARVWRRECEQNYYTVLGVDRGASADEIKKAYRRRMRRSHPDLHAGDKKAEMDASCKTINEAYETLRDSEQRNKYDQSTTI